MSRRLFAGACLLAAALAWGGDDSVAAPGQVKVAGRLVVGDVPVQGGTVSAYSEAALAGSPVSVSQPSGPNGVYSLDLAPGRYYLAAAKGDLWSYCGQNPVLVQRGDSPWIGFDLSRWPPPIYARAPESGYDGRVTGRVVRDGEPLAEVSVSLYLDASEGFRGMPLIRSLPTGADGTFVLDMVPESRYYLIARRRGSGRLTGPMTKGDLFSYYRYNPVLVEGGKVLTVQLPMVRKRQDRDVHGTGVVGQEPGFSGVVRDREGSPVPGLHVFAYLEPEMGHHQPAAISSQTDAQGRYRIFLPGPDRYYIGARDGFGDSPAPGELFGFYEGTADHSLTFTAGQFREGLDITVKRVLEP